MARALVLLALVALAEGNNLGKGHYGAQRESSLLQTYNSELNNGKITPVTRVVNLLKEMTATLEKEQEEDENLYHQLSCWCNDNVYEKKLSAEANTAKIEELTATIERLTARSAELKAKIAELEKDFAADKAALAEATAVREKQLKEFHAMELDNIEAIENLKAALVVLGKHHEGEVKQEVLKTERDSWAQMPVSLLQSPFGDDHESQKTFAFDEFLRKSDFHLSSKGVQKEVEPHTQSHFLQASAASATVNGWSATDQATMRKAMTLLQARHGDRYYPAYAAQSGEIVGVLKQLKAEMEADLKDAQDMEAKRAATFAELRKAKTAEIEAGEKMAEEKEDEKATCDNDLAEAKEDLGQTEKALAEDQKFSGDLEKTCDEASTNFEARKKARLSEIQAVAETIEILTGDEARDAMDTTFSLIQTAVNSESSQLRKIRKDAAAILRKSKNPELAMLATNVELDAFTKVKAMIDKMIEQLKVQQADEVKKNDYCIKSLQENEMQTLKTTDLKKDLEAKIGELEATIKRLSEEIEKAHLDIDNLQVALQRASEDRKAENLDFQKVVADQTVTAEILNKALDKLATFYDEAALIQKKKQDPNAPPVPQMEYKKSAGSTGVMSMIEKLIYDTKDITAKSKKTESEAQAAYEALIANTNESIKDLNAEIVSKTKAKAQAKKDLGATKEDLGDAVQELEDLAKTNADLHAECDYYTKNFNIRQKARAEEIEALQQAKQILNGANLA